HLRPGLFHANAGCERHIRPKTETKIVVLGAGSGKWRPFELHHHLSGCGFQAFAGANQEWNARPSPGIDLEAHCSIGLDLGFRRSTRLAAIAAKLSSHKMGRLDGRNHAENLDLLIANGLWINRGRRLHGKEGDDLQQVILDYIADRARLLVEFSP